MDRLTTVLCLPCDRVSFLIVLIFPHIPGGFFFYVSIFWRDNTLGSTIWRYAPGRADEIRGLVYFIFWIGVFGHFNPALTPFVRFLDSLFIFFGKAFCYFDDLRVISVLFYSYKCIDFSHWRDISGHLVPFHWFLRYDTSVWHEENTSQSTPLHSTTTTSKSHLRTL